MWSSGGFLVVDSVGGESEFIGVHVESNVQIRMQPVGHAVWLSRLPGGSWVALLVLQPVVIRAWVLGWSRVF